MKHLLSFLRAMGQAAKTMLTYIWWAPAWWVTRFHIWRDPESQWTRTTSLLYMAGCATPMFRQVNAALWLVIVIEASLLFQIAVS